MVRFWPPFKYQTIWQLDTNLPFVYETSPVFRWLLYNTYTALYLVIIWIDFFVAGIWFLLCFIDHFNTFWIVSGDLNSKLV